MFVSCGISLVDFFFLMNSENMILIFLISIPLRSCSYFIALTRTSSAMLNRHGKNMVLCLTSDLVILLFYFSQFNLMLAIGLMYFAFIMFRYAPCVTEDF